MLKYIAASIFCTLIFAGLNADTMQRHETQILTWSQDGRLKGYDIGNESLLSQEIYPFSAYDAEKEQTESFVGRLSPTAAGIALIAEAKELQLKLKVNISSSKDTPFFLIDAELENLSEARERAIELRFTLPLKAGSWNFNSYMTDMQNGRTAVQSDTLYEELRILINPRFEMPMSRFPFLAIDNDEIGIMLGHPLTQPRFFRYAFESDAIGGGLLMMKVPLGLSADTEKFPGCAGATFLLGEFDASTHFRGALQKYYRHQPKIFQTHIGYPGAWGLWIQPETMDLAKKCGMGFNQREWDGDFFNNPEQALNILKTTHLNGLMAMMYAEPWGVFMPFPKGWLQAHADPNVAVYYDQAQVNAAALKSYVESFRNDTSPTERFPGDLTNDDLYGIVQNTAIEINRTGDWRLNCYWPNSFEWGKKRLGDDYGMIIVNSDPELTRPNRQTITFEKARYGFVERCLQDSEEKIDGYYIDSEAYAAGWSECNFRRDHWKVADLPLTYAHFPEDNQVHVFQHMTLAHNDFLRFLRQQADQTDRCIGSNTWPFAAFLIPFVDFLGCGEFFDKQRLPSLIDFREFRFLAGQKLVTTMDYVLNFEGEVPVSAEGVMQYIEPRLNWYLQYGIFPGSGNAWADRSKVELLLPVFELYVPLFQAINQAGWEPLTKIELNGKNADQVLRERWGQSLNDGVYFTLHNPTDEPVEVTLSLLPEDFNAMHLGSATELISSRKLSVENNPNKAFITVAIPAERTVLVLCQQKNNEM